MANTDKYTLTDSDKFYIEQNRKKTLDELSESIKKNKELIKNYVTILEQKEHTNSKSKKKGESPLLKQMVRRSGAVALTGEATMTSEEIEKGMNRSSRGIDGKDILPARGN